jgi:predicted TIM-barrel fold metal-dependent hydrolase
MKNGFKIFDSHTHMGAARHNTRSVSADDMLRDMDRNGVDRSLVIPYPVVENYREQHNLIGQAARKHPERFRGAACLNPFIDRQVFRDEVRRCSQEFGFTALKLQPQYQGLNPFSPASDFFFETALENRMAVVVHTGAGLPFSSPSLCMMPARKFPELRIVLAHSGGGIFVQEAIVAASFCPNVYLEMSTLMPNHVLEILNHLPSTRLMIGSDLPECQNTEIGKILTLAIPDEDKRNILERTASTVFDAESASGSPLSAQTSHDAAPVTR